MPNFTKEQTEAICREGENILVSAGAGSGKTAVLSERVLRKVRDNTHINQLLILTFTNKAAAEMKERIRKKLAKEKLQEELDLIDSSYITTFDAFSMAVVKKYADKLAISRNLKVMEDTILTLKKEEILDEIMDTYYQNPSPVFSYLITSFCLKDDKELKRILLSLNDALDLVLDKDHFFKTYLNEYYKEEHIDGFIKEYLDFLNEKQQLFSSMCEDFLELLDEDYYDKVYPLLSVFSSDLSYQELREKINFKLPNLPRATEEEVKQAKAKIVEERKRLEELLHYSNTSLMKEAIMATRPTLEMMLEILKRTDDALLSYKQQENAYTFNDIEKMAIALVRDFPDVREELRDSFHEIMIDEYQDTNDIQEAFISYIAKDNVYAVGDIKQSIYRFRNANPLIFKEKYDRYKKHDGGSVIDLAKNFRSRREVLDDINSLFCHIMDDKIGGASYLDGHAMIFGNEMYLSIGKTKEDYSLDIISYDKEDKEYSNVEKEVFLIAADIKKRLERGLVVFDKDRECLRKASYQDFVILLDRSTDFTTYKQIFEYLGIPLTLWQSESSNARVDLYLLKNIFVLGDKINQKEYDSDFFFAFTSLARSFLYEYKDEEIYSFVKEKKFKESGLYQDFLEITKEYSYLSPTLYFDRFVLKLSYREKLIKIGSVHTYRSRLEYFYNLVRSLEEGGKTLKEVTEYFVSVCDHGCEIKLALSRPESDSVKIMTIHTSKGLEYPFCYFAGFTKKFNDQDSRQSVLYDSTYGIIIPDIENNNALITKTLLLNKIKKEDVSEKIRLFYVALTRAREKIIIVMPKEEEEITTAELVSDEVRLGYVSFEAMMQSVYSHFSKRVKEVGEIPNISKDYLEVKEQKKEEKGNHLELLMVSSVYDKKCLEKEVFSKVETRRFTKEEKENLAYGSYIHDLLEQCDISNRILPDIKDQKALQKIKKFLESDVLNLYRDFRVYQEYEFMIEEGRVESHGKIDLLLVGETFAVIIDYKLQNTTDIAYVKQLGGYKKVIEAKLQKPVICYLYSILGETFFPVAC